MSKANGIDRAREGKRIPGQTIGTWRIQPVRHPSRPPMRIAPLSTSYESPARSAVNLAAFPTPMPSAEK